MQVYNEVGELQRVLVHKPGAEVVRMTQFELEPLLFDDILAIDLARREHDVLQQVLGHGGAEVLEVSDLLLEALRRAPPEAVADLLDTVCEQAAVRELAEVLSALPPAELGPALVEGVAWSEVPASRLTLARLRSRLDDREFMALPPVPNLMFMRDPCIGMYDRVVVGRMATRARARESVLVHFALRYGLDDVPPFLFDDIDWSKNAAYRSLEGGDVLVISPEILLIGCSERTRPETIERLAYDVLFPAFPQLRKVYAVIMPRRRSVMHLDTILTAVDTGLFLGHAPMITRGEGVAVVELAPGRGPKLLEGLTVEGLLKRELGDVEIVPCGGEDPLHQLREQWTDGANAVCLGPGRIVLYSRNVRTARTLVEKHGFDQIQLSEDESFESRAARIGAADGRTVFTFMGSELSRARGGGRCLTMPLARAR
ncbi:MAG: arginine deiminase family protein [Myxococcota bacterium]